MRASNKISYDSLVKYINLFRDNKLIDILDDRDFYVNSNVFLRMLLEIPDTTFGAIMYEVSEYDNKFLSFSDSLQGDNIYSEDKKLLMLRHCLVGLICIQG